LRPELNKIEQLNYIVPLACSDRTAFIFAASFDFLAA
jgi:hypothetical protein